MAFEKWKEEHRRKLADDSGEPSLGRWAVYYGTILSAVLVIVGIGLAIYEVVFQPRVGTFHSNVGLPIITAGVGIYTSGAISKAWQAHAEAKKLLASPVSTPLVVDTPPAEEPVVMDDSNGGQNVGTGTASEDPVNV